MKNQMILALYIIQANKPLKTEYLPRLLQVLCEFHLDLSHIDTEQTFWVRNTT